MSYLRPYSLQPKELRLSALDSWLQHVFHLIRDNHILSMRRPSITPSNSIQSFTNCLKELGSEDDPQTPAQTIMMYFDSMVPPSMQEESFHRGAQMLRKEQLFCDNLDMFPTFFSLFWKPSYKLLNIPTIGKNLDRVLILENLLWKISEGNPAQQWNISVESAKFRLFDQESLGIEESYLTKRILRGLYNLRMLVLWKVADDAMLAIIGATCLHLESLDVWRSTGVSDMGLKFLLSFGAEELPWDEEVKLSKSKLCKSLRRISIKETSCTHIGSVFLIVHCGNLEILDFSHGVVVKEFLVVIRDLYLKNKKTFSLKTLFLPVTSQEILHDVVHAFPLLEDLRLWTSMTQIRGLKSTDFPHLHSLMLGGLHSNQILRDMVVVYGHQLTGLKLETLLTVIPLEVIGTHCKNLVELQLINAKLAIRNHDCSKIDEEEFFPHLKLVYFFLIKYVINQSIEEPKSAIHCVLQHAKHLEGIQATGSGSFTDKCLDRILAKNPLKGLRRFILTDATSNQPTVADTAEHSLRLTSKSVIRLFETCPHLQCVGDLRHWDISSRERREMFKKFQNQNGAKCSIVKKPLKEAANSVRVSVGSPIIAARN